MTVPVMTYNSLLADIANYSERSDPQFLAMIPNLIYLAEQEIAAQVKTLWQLTVVDTTLISGSQGAVLQKPARWRKTVSMSINGEPVMKRGQDYVRQYQYEVPNGQPVYYAEFDYNNWSLAPVPDDEYPVQITYYSLIQPLDENNQENLITREAPQALLYGTLLQAQGYLKSLDKIAVWKGYYDQSMAALKAENNSRNIDRNTIILEP